MFGAKLKVRDVSTSCRLFTVCPFYRVSGGVAAHAATPPNQPTTTWWEEIMTRTGRVIHPEDVTAFFTEYW